MAFSTSSFVGVNCHTDPYSFSMLKPVEALACRKSVHGSSPGVVSDSGGEEKGVEDFEGAFAAREILVGRLRGVGAAGISAAAPESGGFAMPLVFGLILRVWFCPTRLRLCLSKV